MAIEAPVSKFRKNSIIIWAIVCIGFAVYCVYDGYFNDKFIKKHTDANGNPDSTLVFNQKAPPFFIAGAALLVLYLFAIKNKKIVAEEDELVISAKWRKPHCVEKIAYEAIQKIDKTYFDKKGFFTITYKDKGGNELDRKLSDRKYDNLAAILDHLVAKIS